MKFFYVILAALLVGSPMTLSAQDKDGNKEKKQRPTQEQMMQMQTNQMVKALMLDDATAAKFTPVYEQYLKETGDNTPAVIASTASPYKFPDSVLDAFDCEKPADPFAEAELLAKLSNTKIPAPITALRTKPVRFENTCAAADMADFVRETVRV